MTARSFDRLLRVYGTVCFVVGMILGILLGFFCQVTTVHPGAFG